MLSVWLLPGSAALLSIIIVVQYVTVYLWDPKCLRKHYSLNPACGITNLGYLFEIWKGDGFRSRAIAKAHQAHSIIRIGPDALSFSDVRAIKDIYGHSTTCVKGDMYSTTAGSHRSILNSVDKQEHAIKRKRLAAVFATKNLVTWEYKVVDKCVRLVEQFNRLCTEAPEIGFRKWSNLFTIEAIADIAISERLGLIEAGVDTVMTIDENTNTRQVSFLRSLHSNGRVAAPIVWSGRGYAMFKKLAAFLSRRYAENVTYNVAYNGIIHNLVSRRTARRSEKLDDFFTCLVEDKAGEPLALSINEIEAEVGVFMDAGSDTTAIQLTYVMYFLLKNPDKLAKLRQELDRHLTSQGVVPSYASVRDIAYLRACLDESLRLSPPVSFGLQRKTPPEGTSINGEWIEGNVFVSVSAYVAHRDPTIFPDPEKFVPERWLDDKAKEIQKYFIPFSTGARGCIGRNISYIEQHVLIAALLRRYEFSLPHPDWELTWEERFNLWPFVMPLKISRRDISSST